MEREAIMAMQKRIGVKVDGFWGPISQAECRNHLLRLMPSVNPWPAPTDSALRLFYGKPGDEGNLVKMEFPYPMYYEGKRVLSTRVHKRCAESLYRVLSEIGRSFGSDRGVMEEAEDYGGVYNFRNKRGGSSYSLHAWGAAIDLDADDNTFKDTWPLQADMPLEIMECFAREGWLSAGVFWCYDAMHQQATRWR